MKLNTAVKVKMVSTLALILLLLAAAGGWIAEYAEQDTIERLQSLGGMTGTWRTDYSECTYHNPQRINGVLVDLSTIVKVRAFYEASTVGETPRT